MNKLNYTVKVTYPNNPAVDMDPVQVTDRTPDTPTWVRHKVAELMCLLGHAGESQRINIEWETKAGVPTLVLAYNVGTSAETRRVYQIDSVSPAKDE